MYVTNNKTIKQVILDIRPRPAKKIGTAFYGTDEIFYALVVFEVFEPHSNIPSTNEPF